MLLMRQILSGHSALSTQLQVISLVMVLGLLILWFCELIIVFIFGIQLHDYGYVMKTSVFQLLWDNLHCMLDWTILYFSSSFWWWCYFDLCSSVGIAFRVYNLLSLVPPCMVWLSSWIFLRWPITVIILFLLILAAG